MRFDNNQYSVAARAVGRPVDVRAYADRIVIRQDGEIVAAHPRSFGRGEIAYDPWHYVPILTKKPGALRSGLLAEEVLLDGLDPVGVGGHAAADPGPAAGNGWTLMRFAKCPGPSRP